ncbi:hypothetical protein HKX48_001808 [Thoreauomyces humboldtii]|nr:hypothetical protein HKX48_001808 [Thoreauomyces humboldtii]
MATRDPLVAISKLRDKTQDLFHSLDLAKRSYDQSAVYRQRQQHTSTATTKHGKRGLPHLPSRPSDQDHRWTSHTGNAAAKSAGRSRTRFRNGARDRHQQKERAISPSPLTIPGSRSAVHARARRERRSPSPAKRREQLERHDHDTVHALSRGDDWVEGLQEFRQLFPDGFFADDTLVGELGDEPSEGPGTWDAVREHVAEIRSGPRFSPRAETDLHEARKLPPEEDPLVLEDARYYYAGVFRVNKRLFPAQLRRPLDLPADEADVKAGYRWEIGMDERPVKVSVPHAYAAALKLPRPEVWEHPARSANSLDIAEHEDNPICGSDAIEDVPDPTLFVLRLGREVAGNLLSLT